MPVTSSTSRDGPRPTPWTRSGGASSPSGRCCGPASSPTTDPAAAGRDPLPGGSGGGPDRREAAGRAGCWRTPRSSSRWSPPTSSGCRGGPCWPRWWPASATPTAPARLARTRLRAKLGTLAEACCGFFTDQHAFLLAKMLARVDALDADLAELDAKLAELIAGFADAVDRLDEIPGIGQLAAQLLIAELGTDMTRFPTAGHLVSWAKFAPGVKESAGNPKGRGSTGHGNPYLGRVLGEAAVAASKTDTFLGERYRRIARRRGKQRAIVAVGRSILVIVWHLLSDQRPLPRPRRWLLRHPGRSRTRQAQPRPPARGPRLQGHPPTRRLTGRHRATGATLIGSGLRPDTAACLLSVDFRIRMKSEVQVLAGPQPAFTSGNDDRRVHSWLGGACGGSRPLTWLPALVMGQVISSARSLPLLLDRSPGWRSEQPPGGGRWRTGRNYESWPIHSWSRTGRWRSLTAAERSMGGRTRWPRSHGQSNSAIATSRPTCR